MREKKGSRMKEKGRKDRREEGEISRESRIGKK